MRPMRPKRLVRRHDGFARTASHVFIIAEGSFLSVLSLSRHLHTARILRIQGHWSCHDYNASIPGSVSLNLVNACNV